MRSISVRRLSLVVLGTGFVLRLASRPGTLGLGLSYQTSEAANILFIGGGMHAIQNSSGSSFRSFAPLCLIASLPGYDT